MINTFGVIGGDERMKYLAQSIAADGYPVCVCGLEKLGTCRGAAECDLPQLAAKSSVILLPLPATKDGLFLNAPYAENEIRLDDDFARLFMHKSTHNRRERPVHGHRGRSMGPFYYRITTFGEGPWDARDPHKTTFMTLSYAIGLSI